ncbi:glycosyltransferase [bacterium]|nr:glycosyltransferase [bacterium]
MTTAEVLEQPMPSAVRPRVAILIVGYCQRELLRDCLTAVVLQTAGDFELITTLVVDNGSPAETFTGLAEQFPQIEWLRLEENRGFAGGNNAGWRWLRERYELDYVMLLNHDTVVQPGWLPPLIDWMEQHAKVAAAQSLLLLDQPAGHINTLGNACHYLGFGLMTAYGQPIEVAPQQPREIASPSGAAVLIRCEAMGTEDLFDARYFLYLEDTELGWRLRSRGLQCWLVPESQLIHRYTFTAPFQRYGYLERNRWWLWLTYHRLPTLLLLAPAMLLMEIGQWLFAAQHGLLPQRWWAYRELLSPAAIRHQFRIRRQQQRLRTVSDRELSRNLVAMFDETLLPGWLVQRVANPVFAAYWWCIRWLIWW